MRRIYGSLWLRWTLANGVAELLGLGATFALVALLATRVDDSSRGGIVILFLLAVGAGLVEGLTVALAQWWAMKPWFAQLRGRTWVGATLVGVLLAYVVGYLPSTLMGLQEAAGEAPAVEPPQWIVLLLAAGLGAGAGFVLSVAQWLAMRARVAKAGLWIPANMLAWAVGMPIIFQGMEVAFAQQSPATSVLVVAISLLTAGLAVGGIHGRFLLRMAEVPEGAAPGG